MSDSVTKFKENQTDIINDWYETNTRDENMSSREISNAKRGMTSNKTATEILKKEYPIIYAGYMDIINQQLELFSKKHLDYGMGNISAGTNLENEDERSFALTGLWYRISDKINRWKNLMVNPRGPQNETIIDTFQDVCNYAIIAQLVKNNQWKK
tara:strand:- start:6811 stop:7275 length:465 start_codon:yes stop_codon:yes gene_type:complete